MDILSDLTPLFFFLTIAGTFVGIIFGAIPGMTATMAVAVCLPLTYSLGLINGMALLLGLYVGGISGGLVPAILLNIPGTPSSITTTFDGYPMAQRGEGERALKLGIAASLFGGMFSLLILYLFAPALADFAIKFSYVEKFLIIFLALTVMAALSGNMLIGIFSGVLGMLISLIGAYDVSDGGNGEYRLMFPFMEYYLDSGFSLLPVLIGLFGLSAILIEAEQGVNEESGLSTHGDLPIHALPLVRLRRPVREPFPLGLNRHIRGPAAGCRGQRRLGAVLQPGQDLLQDARPVRQGQPIGRHRLRDRE